MGAGVGGFVGKFVGAGVGGLEGAGVGCITQKQMQLCESIINKTYVIIFVMYKKRYHLTSLVGAGVGGSVGLDVG